MTDDELRYREYLQSVLATKGWEEVFAEMRNRRGLDEMCALAAKRGLDPVAFRRWCETQMREHPAVTKHDVPDLARIFYPLLGRIEAAASSMNLKLDRPVVLATSTNASPTPFARPSTGDHTLFIGPGTGKFCNAWAKAITSVAMTGWGKSGVPHAMTRDELAGKLEKKPDGLAQAIQLVSHYSQLGTVLGFDDDIVESRRAVSHRSYLLDAMETFVVGHEYSHFIAEERQPDLLDPASSQKLEGYCDLYGILLSRQASHNPQNFHGFAAVGAVVFLRCVELCDSAYRMKHPNAARSGDSHPPTDLRIEEIKRFVSATTTGKSIAPVTQWLESYDSLCAVLSQIVLEVFTSALKAKPQKLI